MSQDFGIEWDDTIGGAKLDSAISSAVSAGAEVLRREAVLRTPLDTGELQDSAGIDVDGNEASVYFDKYYAPIVHEDLTARHFVGESKFLEKALTHESDRVMDAIASDMQRALGG